jgi:hypothetical protein
MVVVRRPHRNTKADEDYERTQYIRHRLDSIRNQRIRVSNYAGYAFDDRKTQVDEDAGKRRP